MLKPSFFLQRLIFSLPSPLRRMKLARALSRLWGSDGYHFLEFQSGYLNGHISEGQITYSLVTKHFEDYGYFELANHLLSGGGVYFDVGANFGFHSFGLDGFMKPNYEFHLFEPNPICCRCIRNTLDAYGLDHRCLVATGIGNSPGKAFLQFNQGVNVQGWLSPTILEESANSSQVAVQTLDDYSSVNSIQRVTLLKMDIEGSEWHALCGADNLFKSASVDFCYFEVNEYALARRGVSLNQLFNFFIDRGYILCWPHTSTGWIQPRLLPSTEIQAVSYACPDGIILTFARFEPEMLNLQAVHQFDLLAISPRLQLAPSATYLCE